MKNLANQLSTASLLVACLMICSGAYWPMFFVTTQGLRLRIDRDMRLRLCDRHTGKRHLTLRRKKSLKIEGLNHGVSNAFGVYELPHQTRNKYLPACVAHSPFNYSTIRFISCPYSFQLPQVFTTTNHIFGRINDHFFGA